MTKAIVSNKGLIEINQDPIGIPVNRVKKTFIKDEKGDTIGNIQIWSGVLVDGAVVAFVNTAPTRQTLEYSLAAVYPPSVSPMAYLRLNHANDL